MKSKTATVVNLKPEPSAPPATEIKSGSASEETLQLDPLRESLKELAARHERLVNAREDYKTLVAAVAEKAHCAPAVVRSFVAARMSEHGARAQERTLQLALLFEEFGI